MSTGELIVATSCRGRRSGSGGVYGRTGAFIVDVDVIRVLAVLRGGASLFVRYEI